MNKIIGFTVGGFLAGIIVTGLLVWTFMPSMMLSVHESRFDFETTVSTLEKAVKQNGWILPKKYDLKKSLQKAGHSDMTKMTIFSLCHPDYAYDILKVDEDKRVSAIMPCRISIYEDHSGKVFITGMNMKLMSKMFGGNIEKVMAHVSSEEHDMLLKVIVD